MPQKPPKKMTQQRLRNIAEAYVSRYGGSIKRLRSVLIGRADRSLRFHGETARKDEVAQWIDEVIAERVRQGGSDDAREARVMAIRLSLSGRPQRVIAMRLRQKGFESQEIEAALVAASGAAQGDVDGDWIACCRYARRRGLGPFRSPTAREKPRDKQLAAFMRAGFRYGLAVRVLDTEDPAELQAVVDDAPLPTLS